MFKVDRLPNTEENTATFININLVAMINLYPETNSARITLNLSYHSIPTTLECGNRLITEMEEFS